MPHEANNTAKKNILKKNLIFIDYFYIKSNLPINQVEVYNLNGQRLLVQNDSLDKVDISHLASAIYFVRISSETAIKTVRLIKE